MWQFGLLCLFIAGANAGYASSGAGAGSYSGPGTGSGLYTSNYVDDDTYGSAYPYIGGYTYIGSGIAPPLVPVFTPFGFNNDLQNFIHSQYNLLQNQFNRVASTTYAIASKGAAAKAKASFILDKPHQFNAQIAQQQAFFDHLQQESGYVPAPGETVIYTNSPEDKVKVVHTKYAPSYSSGGYGTGGVYGASSSGSVGPGGVYQSVSTYPGGTISNRFGGGGTTTYTSGGGGRPGGSYSGISTSSSSDSSGNRQAITTVNDNGKVTTYHTRAK